MPTNRSSSPPDGGRSAMRHMGLAATLLAGIGGGAWLGSLWDDRSGHEVAWATALGAMVGLAASLTVVFRDLSR
ncbi:MAG: AtpZ/AtpI family protein [Flavobacteriales bacterium]